MSEHRFSDSRLLSIRDFGDHRWIGFYCPGCKKRHVIVVGRSGDWTFDGNEDAPTFSPSVLAKGTIDLTDDQLRRLRAGENIGPVDLICHTFVRNGRIEFLSDCTHSLAGKTVPMVPIIPIGGD